MSAPDDTAAEAAEPWRQLYPFASHWLEVDGRRMHYLDESPPQSAHQPAETLLFVHGNPTWSFHWRHLVEDLRSRYRCVAVDHLGCGLSDKSGPPLRLADRIDHLAMLIDRLQLRQVTLVAQDWGGAVGLGALLRRREQFDRIVLFNTGAFPPPSVPLRIRVCRMPLLGRLAVQGLNAFSRAALWMTLARQRKLPPEVAAGYLAPYNSWHHRHAVYDFVADIPNSPRHPSWQVLTDIEAELPSLADMPCCLIWGMCDWCFTPRCLERFADVWPGAVVHRLTDVGHWVVEDAPDEALKRVREFLARSGKPIPASGGSAGTKKISVR